MSVPKGSRLEYWDDLDDEGKANKFFRHANLDPSNTRGARIDKDAPCKICDKKIKGGQRYYGSTNASIIAHDFCVDKNRTLEEAKPEEPKRFADNVRSRNVGVQPITPNQKPVSIVAEAFTSGSERANEAADLMLYQQRKEGGLTNALQKLIWKLGMERLSQLIQEGADLAELLK
jgi:hypothetical protein